MPALISNCTLEIIEIKQSTNETKTNMFYHCILFLSQIRIWTIMEGAYLLLLDRLHVLVRSVNPSIWYGLTHKLVSIILEHSPRLALHVFAFRMKSSLQFENQALAKSGVSGLKLWKRMTKKLTQKLLHTAHWEFPYIALRARA
jgi:hypothetical protein